MRVGLLLFVTLWSAFAHSHPLGNNTVNRQAAVLISGDAMRIDYRLDLAEIPTLLAAQSADRDGDGEVSSAEWQEYARDWAAALLPALQLTVDRRELAAHVERFAAQLVDGAAGLEQLRLQALFYAPITTPGRRLLAYRDLSQPEQAGWREIWVSAAPGADILHTTAARVDRSLGLTRFPPSGGPLLNETATAIEVQLDGRGAHAMASPTTSPTTSASTRQRGLLALYLLGAHHIASGWDHLVFLLGLVLLSRSRRALFAVVTAFTLAHSLTLGLAATGLLTPPGNFVEAAIALSIAYVGLCNVFRRQRAHGVALAFGFGLVHGFGFAGALAATLGREVLDGHGWLLDLAAFNLGIETFQLALLCVVVPVLRLGARWSWAPLARRAAAHGVLWAGLGWFALRVNGL